MTKLEVLDPRGGSPFWTIESDGIRFYCSEGTTSMPVYGLYVDSKGESKENETQEDDGDFSTTKTWELFVPFGKTAEIYWLNQHVVTVLCTVKGPLEIVSEWIGGGDECYNAYGILPNGDEVTVEGNLEPNIDANFISDQWEESYPKLCFCKVFVGCHSNQ